MFSAIINLPFQVSSTENVSLSVRTRSPKRRSTKPRSKVHAASTSSAHAHNTDPDTSSGEEGGERSAQSPDKEKKVKRKRHKYETQLVKVQNTLIGLKLSTINYVDRFFLDYLKA